LSLDGLERLESFPFDGRTTLAELLADGRLSLKRQAVRIVISDFLFPCDPAALVRRLASDASSLWLIQVLTAWEANPTALGGRRLIDAETSDQSDIVIDRAAIAEYLARLAALQGELLRSCRRAHATFATLVADRGLPAVCRDDLCATGILRVA
jgi:hypothetical protein